MLGFEARIGKDKEHKDMNKQSVVAGIDVGKFNLDISISSTQEHRRMQNHEDA